MRKKLFAHLPLMAPTSLVAGMACFVAALLISNAWVKDGLLLGGLALVVASVLMYVATWKHENNG